LCQYKLARRLCGAVAAATASAVRRGCERLAHQQDRGLVRHGPGDRHPLLHAPDDCQGYADSVPPSPTTVSVAPMKLFASTAVMSAPGRPPVRAAVRRAEQSRESTISPRPARSGYARTPSMLPSSHPKITNSQATGASNPPPTRHETAKSGVPPPRTRPLTSRRAGRAGRAPCAVRGRGVCRGGGRCRRSSLAALPGTCRA
jgi:hypothetical protein